MIVFNKWLFTVNCNAVLLKILCLYTLDEVVPRISPGRIAFSLNVHFDELFEHIIDLSDYFILTFLFFA